MEELRNFEETKPRLSNPTYGNLASLLGESGRIDEGGELSASCLALEAIIVRLALIAHEQRLT